MTLDTRRSQSCYRFSTKTLLLNIAITSYLQQKSNKKGTNELRILSTLKSIK